MSEPQAHNLKPGGLDLSRLLADWPFESGKISARLIMGDDGEPRVQIRLDVGILQMHTEGRPDGIRPRGFESLLEFQEARLDEAMGLRKPIDPNSPSDSLGDDVTRPSELEDLQNDRANEPSDEMTDALGQFTLSTDDCRELREEAVQYYQRFTGLLVLEDFDGVVRDTTRNLRVLDLCKRFGPTESDRNALEQFRAYITMTRARALASSLMRDNEHKAALFAIEDGLAALKNQFDQNGASDSTFDTSAEVQTLHQMREALLPKVPLSARAELKKRLAQAIAKENYELAAILRDELKALTDDTPSPPPSPSQSPSSSDPKNPPKPKP